MKGRTRIKVCGTTNSEDALKAVELGVDALGFIFARKSPRYITPEQALDVVEFLPPFLCKVGVFVDEDPQEIEEITHYLGLNGLQLHGQEEPEICKQLGNSLSSCHIMKAFRVGNHSKAADFSEYNEVVSGFVLDTYVKDVEGGTGLSFDWNIIQRLELKRPFILAGGLNPDNIQAAIQQASPFGVDVNSGVEHAPGLKDHILLERLVSRVNSYGIVEK